MRLPVRSTLAAALLPAAVLTTACGTSPMEPTAPATASTQPQNLTGYVVAWGKKSEPAASQPQNLTGYVVAWGKKGESAAAQPQNLTGYVVAWGKKEQPQSQPQNLTGYVVAWGKNGGK